MGLSDELGWDDDITPQQTYYGQLESTRAHSPRLAEKMSAGGPPPPMDADGLIGKILWHEYHLPTTAEYAALVEQMRAERILPASDACVPGDPPTADDVAALKTRLIEHQRSRG
ncbi:hypothetical protein ACW9HR_37365 [Nocardia gipuzkoensis]